MLSLPDDYDILSLGLLNYQVRSVTVHLEDQPNGCFANFNSTSQNMAVGRVLLKNVTSESSADQLPCKNEVVCVSMIQATSCIVVAVVKHHELISRINGPQVIIQCDLPTGKGSDWIDIFNGILTVVSVFITYYLPAFPLALPDYIFSLQYECDKEEHAEAEQIDECAIRSRNDYEQIPNGSREEEGEQVNFL